MNTTTISQLSTDLYDVLCRVLQAAHEAPSVGHTQPWDFVLVADPNTRGQFADLVRHGWRTGRWLDEAVHLETWEG